MLLNEQAGFLKAVLDAIPAPVFIVDDDVRIVHYNAAGSKLLGDNPAATLKRRSGDAMHCIHALESPGGCGSGPACRDCAIRNSVREARLGKQVSRRMQRMQIASGAATAEVNMLVTTSPFQYGGDSLVLLVLEDISELTSLRRIVPMCASCRKVRDGEAYWQQVESYFRRYLDIDVTHGICPECEKHLYPEFSTK